jgi:hypothetical protein
MNYGVQYERVIRWFERFKTINSGKMHTTSTENYEDEVHAFFQNCYHLKDWIKNDTSITRLLDVEKYINATVSLQLCADICNALKHLSRNRPNRSGKDPEFGKQEVFLDLGTSGRAIRITYWVDTKDGPMDAFALATDCVAAWDCYIRTYIKA